MSSSNGVSTFSGQRSEQTQLLIDQTAPSTKAVKAPGIHWTKAMNYMLSICAYRQQVARNVGKPTTDWHAVLEIVNATFPRFPAFVHSYPNGLHIPGILRSQLNDKHRPNDTNLSEHRGKPWILEMKLCTNEEKQEFAGHLGDLIEAEKVLSLQSDSRVIRNTEDPLVWWIEYNVAKSEAERQIVYHRRPSTDTDSDGRDSQDGEQESEDEGFEDEDFMGEQKLQEQTDENNEDNSESTPPARLRQAIVRPLQQSARSGNPLHYLTPTGMNRASDNYVGMLDAPNGSAVNARGQTFSLSQGAPPQAPSADMVARMTVKSDGSVIEQPGSQRRNVQPHPNNNDPLPNSAFGRLIARLNSWPRLPMVHTRKVILSSEQPVVGISGGTTLGNLLVNSTSPLYTSFAGLVHRSMFKDENTEDRAEVDILTCNESACVACNVSDLPTAQLFSERPKQPRPIVYEEDVRMVLNEVPAFQPKGATRDFAYLREGHSYVSDVVFTGGKRVTVDIACKPRSHESINYRSGDILDCF